ncbi:hypothetical protein PoB_001812700 [Plakobranchus ocellatus]|uniref:Uncharacterized protein n=1 Tax=Plakobranchus ocellatus TaxID=259542 RepID=A0AAV3Z8Q0_9GAST|nr:hypothetical protein PoB_001812700 [Plakobranchus ocellatus]
MDQSISQSSNQSIDPSIYPPIHPQLIPKIFEGSRAACSALLFHSELVDATLLYEENDGAWSPIDCMTHLATLSCRQRIHSGTEQLIPRGGHWSIPGIRTKRTKCFFSLPAQTTHGSGKPIMSRSARQESIASLLHEKILHCITPMQILSIIICLDGFIEFEESFIIRELRCSPDSALGPSINHFISNQFN